MTAAAQTGTPARPVALFVLGMGRSGTSAITRVLSLCGGTLPAVLLDASESNPLGHWEPYAAIEVNEAILRRHGCSWYNPSLRLQEEGALDAEESAASIAEIRAFLNTLPAAPLVILKEVRITALSSMWFEAARLAGFDIVTVIAVRHPQEVIASLAARDHASPELSSALWLKYNLLADRDTRALPRVFVEYANLLDNWRREIKRISAALAIDLSTRDDGAIEEFLKQDLRRQRQRGPVTEFFGTNWTSAVYEALCAAARDEPWDTSALDRVFEAYRASEHGFRMAFDDFRNHFKDALVTSTASANAQKFARDADLLPAEVERNPGDARSVFCLAQSYFDAGDFGNARKWYARRAEMGGWAEEVYFAMFRGAQAMALLGEPWPDIQDALLRSWAFRPTRAEPLYQIAVHYRVEQQYRLGYLFAERAAQIPLPEEDILFVFADVYAWCAIDEQAVCASWIGKHAEAFTLCRRLLARPDIPDDRRPGIAHNRDVSVLAMVEAVSSYPDALVGGLIAGPREAEVTVSLVAGPDRETTEQTLDSFLHCCLDLSRVGRFVVLDAGLSAPDRARLRKRYGFLEFAPRRSGDAPGAQLAQLGKQIGGRFWLHLGQGWRFFAPENYITRLSAVLDAEPQVVQVGINYGDAAKLTNTCAAEQEVRRAPDAGRYVLTDAVASGPAMFDTARLDQTTPPGIRPDPRGGRKGAGGLKDTDSDPIAALGRRATAAGLGTASLDEVLCVTEVPVSAAEAAKLAARETAAFIAEHLPGVPALPDPHDTLRFALRQTKGSGLALEFGVGRGTTLRIIADALSGEHGVVGFDCFTGLPEAWRPGFPAGWFKQDEQPVVPGARLVVGMFETTLSTFLQENSGRIAFVHLDADLYSSTSTVLRLLGDRLGPDTVLVFDEFFNYPGWRQHEYRAWCEFIAERGHEFDYLAYTVNHQQVAIQLR